MSLKAFRLFVSSTFADFKLEREVLQHQVFPALDAYCAAKGYQFYPLDLRWGVSEEAQLDQRATEICLGEVRAALSYPPPNFLIMLGNRYGWVPLPYAIAGDEFEAVASFLQDQGLNNAVQGLSAVYERDDNHLVPPGLLNAGSADDALVGAYTLRSREEMQELRTVEAWETMERVLRQALQEAANALLALGRINALAHEKYVKSLTEREIRLALVGDQTVAADAGGPAAIAFIREITNEVTTNSRFIESEPRVAVLKHALKGALSAENILANKVELGQDGELDGSHLEAFASEIETKLKAAIDRHIAHVEALERFPDFALQAERAIHRAFAAQKLKVFFGRNNNLAAIERYLDDGSEQLLVLYGRSGLGKSALMARAVKAAEEKAKAPVIARFVGASAASSNLRSLLLSLVDDLAALGLVTKPDEFEQGINKFNGQIEAVLASIDKPVIIFFDALDQLQAPRPLGWLPRKLPPHVKLVVSVLNDSAYEADSDVYRRMKQRLAAYAFLEIEPLLPSQGREILLALEQQSRCRLQEGQRDYVVAQFELAGASPLYLKTAFEIAKSWKSTAQAGQGRYVLAPDTSAVIAQFIDELSLVHHHKPELVARTLGFLSAAKDGLSESELCQVLSGAESVMRAIASAKHSAVTDKLPSSVWTRLYRDLAPFLVEKLIDDQPLVQFFHRQVAQVVREWYYETVKIDLHKWLADYFETQATRQGDRAIYSKRGLSELPYQLHFANEFRGLDRILESPVWIEQKFKAFGTLPVIRDYELFGRGGLQPLIGRTLRLVANILARDPRQLFPQICGRIREAHCEHSAAFIQMVRRSISPPALVPVTSSLTTPSVEVLRLEGRGGSIECLTATPQGLLASGESNGIIQLWETRNGIQVGELVGHSGAVHAVAVIDNSTLVSGGADGSIRLWNIDTYNQIDRFEIGHSVSIFLPLPGGYLACGSNDGDLTLWRIEQKRRICAFHFESGVKCLAKLPDGRLVAGVGKHVWVCNLVHGETEKRERLHVHGITAVAVLEDGRLVSSSYEYFPYMGNGINVWDRECSEAQSELRCMEGRVLSLAALSGNRLASGTDQGIIMIWDAQQLKVVTRLKGPAKSVTALASLSPDRLVSGSVDGTLNIWDLSQVGSKSEDGKGFPKGEVSAIVVLKNGKVAFSNEHEDRIKLVNDKGRMLYQRTLGISNFFCEHEFADATIRYTGVNALAVLVDGRVAVGMGDGSVRVWNAKCTKEDLFWENRPYCGQITTLTTLSHSLLAVGYSSGEMLLLDLERRVPAGQYAPHNGRVTAMITMPDGRIVSGAGDGVIRVWGQDRGKPNRILKGHRGWIRALTQTVHGNIVSSSQEDPHIRLWDVSNARKVATLGGHSGGVLSLVALPNGQLVSGGLTERFDYGI